MTFRRRQLLGMGILAGAVLCAVGWLARLDYGNKISSDVLDLLPTTEGAPELALVRQLASQAEARTVLLVLTSTSGRPVPAGAAQRFATELTRSGAFDQALPLADTVSRDELGHELFERRFTLLFPLWLHEREAVYTATGLPAANFSQWLAADVVSALGQFLATPQALAFQDIVPADPLLLMPGLVDRLKGGLALVQPPALEAGASPTLVWARLAASPLSEAGQAPAFAAIARAAAATSAEFSPVTVAFTGVNRFASASRARIEREVSWINALSLAAVLAVALIFIRSAHRGLHLVPVVLLAVLGAWVFTTMAFPRVHILVFVVGSLLTGVAIDYGFYLFMQPPAWPDETYWEKVRRLAKPLLASCFTTVAGFALLLFSELPLIRQLGVFVGTGLVCALAGAVIYFSTVRDPFLPARAFRGGQALPAEMRRWIRRLLIAAWIVALPGLARLTWKDDIRELDIPSPLLAQEDARIHALFGDRKGQTIYLTTGADLGEARAAVEKLLQWLNTAGGGRTQTIGLAAVIPTITDHEHALRFVCEHPEFTEQLRTALTTAGYDDEAFTKFFGAYANYANHAKPADLAVAVKALQARLSGPLGLLLHSGRPLSWFVTLASEAPLAAPPTETHTVSANQLQSLNRVFGRYRQSALWLSLTGLAIVGAGVFLTYGWRDGARIFAIPCGACLGLFGWLGWLGLPLNLFHLLGAFLGVCLTHNYSIFSVTSAYRREPPPISVRVSALTAAASFGVLALSGIPVVRALGSTVAMMVLAALLVIEFEYFAPIAEKS